MGVTASSLEQGYLPTAYEPHCASLVLVPKGSPAACVFSHSAALAGGGVDVRLTLSSHPGLAVVARAPTPKTVFVFYDYVELGVGPAHAAVCAALHAPFLVRAGASAASAPACR